MPTFCKAERQNKRSVISRLFESRGKSFSLYPLRIVYMPVAESNPEVPVSILISVPKRCFKHAVDRNRVKRQVREAYRLNKHILHQALEGSPHGLVIAFIWLDKELHPSAELAHKVKGALCRLAEKIIQS